MLCLNNKLILGGSSMDLTELFCDIDDFYKQFEPYWKQKLIANGENVTKKKLNFILAKL